LKTPYDVVLVMTSPYMCAKPSSFGKAGNTKKTTFLWVIFATAKNPITHPAGMNSPATLTR
jgi:hypothetical protein